MSFSKAIRFFSVLLVTHLIAAGPVSSDEPNVMLGTSKRAYGDLPIYPYEFEVTKKGVQGPFYFKQSRDHLIQGPDRFTFPQRYWVNDEYYVHDHGRKHPGPIFLIISDQEVDKNMNLLGKNPKFDSRFLRMAQRYRGMLVVLEHRYFGESYPVDDLSERNLEYLTIRQALGDVQQFALAGMGHEDLEARTVPTSRLHRKFVPWVLIGGGYTGGLVHWAMKPERSLRDVFWAGYSSSGMIRADENLWRYWEETSRILPPGCAKDVAEVVKYFDEVFYSTLTKEESAERLGQELGLTQIKHADDMAEILSHAIDYATSRKRVDSFCDALERDEDGNIPEDENGRGLSWALAAWRIYNQETRSKYSDSQWSSHDMTESKYNDRKPRAVSSRVSKWLRCNELGWFKAAPDSEQVEKLVVSRLLNIDRERRICRKIFPKRYREKNAPYVSKTNSNFGGGRNGPAARVFYFNGGMDPNLSVTLQADNTDTGEIQQFVESAPRIGDYRAPLGKNIDIDEATSVGVGKIGKWLDEWYLEIAMDGLRVG